ncbi:uncharacterized protein TNCV_5020411 [Trichonephila clavipes]|nr:uncharacterized protein TNCV_5020411 [Trichonephila clavipes]
MQMIKIWCLINEYRELQLIGTVHSAGVYKKRFSICWSQFLFNFGLEFFSTTEKMPRRRIRAHYEQMSVFERDRIIGLKEAGWTKRKITFHMGRSNAAIRKCWQEWVDSGRFQSHDGSGRSTTTADREDRLIVKSAVTAPVS